jgi:hypothetical protein
LMGSPLRRIGMRRGETNSHLSSTFDLNHQVPLIASAASLMKPRQSPWLEGSRAGDHE